MKKLSTMLVITIFVQLFVVGLASANTSSEGYQSEGDITIEINVLEDDLQTSGELGDTSFELQESVHHALEDSTGESVPHSYIWIKVNGQNVIGIDPPRPMFN